jgi:hypothetical protein
MKRFGSQIYTPSKKRLVPALAIYTVVTLPKGIYNTMAEASLYFLSQS